jgi:hypothetical protein
MDFSESSTAECLMNRYRYLPVLLLSLLFSIPSYAHHLAVVVPKANPGDD